MSLKEMWCMFARETQLPPTGPAYKLARHVISRFAVPCTSCNGSGSKVFDGKDSQCAGCGGFRNYLSPAAIRRAHQIVRAAFPTVSTLERTNEAARRWSVRESHPTDKPMYLGYDTLPPSASRAPPKDAIAVASITWRRGLRSEFLWAPEGDLSVLWERLPDLLLPGNEPWAEIFALARGAAADPNRAAQRLVQLGWADTNPAYGWLTTSRPAVTAPFKPFSVGSSGLLSAAQLEWLFRSAARARHEDAKLGPIEADSKRSAPSRTRNIGPYPFPSHRTKHEDPKPQARNAADIEQAVPFRRNSKRIEDGPSGDSI